MHGSTPVNRGHAAIAIVGCSFSLGGRPRRLGATQAGPASELWTEVPCGPIGEAHAFAVAAPDHHPENTVELQKLHEAILNEMSSIFTYEGVQKEMFYSPPPVNEIPLFWVKGFAETSVRENYKPHITLGVGEPKQAVSPVQFTASKLALCHLGNHCTCRDLLWSASLA